MTDPHSTASTPAAGSRPRGCDNTSVGVLIWHGGRLLVFDRAAFPPGVAPAAGHVDEHGGWEAAARAEVAEETGLTVTRLTRLAGGWRANRCRRETGPRGTGHHWEVYEAAVTGDLVPSARETRNMRWAAPRDLQILALRTAAYACGRLTGAEFATDPGIEPVWVRWLHEAGIVDISEQDLTEVDRLTYLISPDRPPGWPSPS